MSVNLPSNIRELIDEETGTFQLLHKVAKFLEIRLMFHYGLVLNLIWQIH